MAMDRGQVKEALQQVIAQADYDLVKSLDPEINEDGEDRWPELVDLFISVYEGEPSDG